MVSACTQVEDPVMPLAKIVSGGQSGVDRGALDAALAAGFPCGGWCPPGRAAEDGPIPERYPLSEMPDGGYRKRTVQNIIDSDATLVIYFDFLRGGTEQTVLHCIRRKKPYKLIDGNEITPGRAAELAGRFVAQRKISVLNVAGPRNSQAPGAYPYVLETIRQLLRTLGEAAIVHAESAPDREED
jgi:Circularly permutated YpsA SLOG family